MNAGPGTKILFVDDEESIRLTLSAVLNSVGFSVTTAASVPEALQFIATTEFDVLISDLNIGEPADGFTVVSAMRRTQPNAVTLILTGYPAFESALEAIRQQVDDYLTKPTETLALVENIKAKIVNRGVRPGHRPQKRLPDLIEEQHDFVVRAWLQAVKADEELMAVPLSDHERIDHLPGLLKEATQSARGALDEEARRHNAAVHGATRKRQGFTIPMMIKEAAILKNVVGISVQDNLLSLQVSYIVPDLAKLAKTIMMELEESVRSFLKEEEKLMVEAKKESKRRQIG